MEFALRFLWLDAGQNPDYTKGDKVSGGPITGYFLPMFNVTRPQLQAIRDRGKTAGVYMAWNWPEFKGLSGAEVADVCADEYAALKVSDLRLQYDIERHDAVFVKDVLVESRRLLPNVGTSWTLESRQGGWFTPELVKAIVDTKTRVVPQLYPGDMSYAYDSKYAVDELLKTGVPYASLTPMYDAARLPAGWSGYAFSQGRLP